MVQRGLGRRRCDDGRVQGGGAVWRRGGVNDMPNKVNALILILKMVWRKMVAADSRAGAVVPAESLLVRFLLPTYRQTAWWLGAGLRVFLAWRARWSGVSSTIYEDESQRHDAAGSRRPVL